MRAFVFATRIKMIWMLFIDVLDYVIVCCYVVDGNVMCIVSVFV